eukprot:CAMPEP_0177212202 /NCGR_PEP_ID=MMETSP0367-20130122/32508_1 /TAXON_ID=447022 ORGANISM="Scrippsiella hangoei-like, Strain SHHI-4" /NCGR_SAMPLE_ID=MMETSP0367 /ASSEMBLY_ACC=CAM_ASM_000362 /LENGTH=37 /DNA_ID= /DNA_START= /DNA_END= /DNA_ORIENTATION=
MNNNATTGEVHGNRSACEPAIEQRAASKYMTSGLSPH